MVTNMKHNKGIQVRKVILQKTGPGQREDQEGYTEEGQEGDPGSDLHKVKEDMKLSVFLIT